MKKLLLAAALFIASDAAFAHSSVLSGNNNGPAFVRHPNGVVEPPIGPERSGHKVKSVGADTDPILAFLFRLYLCYMH